MARAADRGDDATWTHDRVLVDRTATAGARDDQTGGIARLQLCLDGRSVRIRRPVADRVVGFSHCASDARHRDHANGRAHSDSRRDGSANHGSPFRRPIRVGPGVSGPQVVEGWYGQPDPRPVERTREYIDIVRQVLARPDRVVYEGNHYHLPYGGGTGLGKALKSTVHPMRPELPIYLAAEGPKSVALAAEIADGWSPFWFSPKSDDFYRQALAEGFGRDGSRHALDDFEVACPDPVVPNPDPEAAADVVRPMLALYVGGMGAKGANFHFDVLARMGWEEVCHQIQDLYLSGRRDEAMKAIPLELIEDVALVGPASRPLKSPMPHSRRCRDRYKMVSSRIGLAGEMKGRVVPLLASGFGAIASL